DLVSDSWGRSVSRSRRRTAQQRCDDGGEPRSRRNRTFGTQGSVSLFADQSLGFGTGKGPARILSTSKSLVCTALVPDISNHRPTSMAELTIIKKAKQKAAN